MEEKNEENESMEIKLAMLGQTLLNENLEVKKKKKFHPIFITTKIFSCLNNS